MCVAVYVTVVSNCLWLVITCITCITSSASQTGYTGCIVPCT